MNTRAWQGRSLCPIWVYALAHRLLRVTPPGPTALMAHLIATVVVFLSPRLRRQTAPFWRQLRPHTDSWEHYRHSVRQYASFARTLCERQLLYRHAYQLEGVGMPHLERAFAADEGCVLLVAHLGNWEFAGRLVDRLRAPPVHVVMADFDDPRLRQLVDAAMGDRAPTIIDPRDGLGAALAIDRALTAGEVVGMMGDRLLGPQRAHTAPFLGRPMRFPLGPFLAAAHAGVPILSCFCLRTGLTSYRVEVDPPLRVARRHGHGLSVARAVRLWSLRLERRVRRHPHQWHNFFDVWS